MIPIRSEKVTTKAGLAELIRANEVQYSTTG